MVESLLITRAEAGEKYSEPVKNGPAPQDCVKERLQKKRLDLLGWSRLFFLGPAA